MSPSVDAPVPGARVLVVLRHAKAESFAEEDHARRLTERGRRDAAAAGRWLAEQGLVPTHACVSSATRALETWEEVAEASGAAVSPRVEQALFAATAESAIEVLRGVPEDARVLVYVGHNPTAASVAHLLDDGDPDPDAFRAMSAGFPTSAMAVLEIGVPWADLDVAGGHLAGFHVGQG